MPCCVFFLFTCCNETLACVGVTCNTVRHVAVSHVTLSHKLLILMTSREKCMVCLVGITHIMNTLYTLILWIIKQKMNPDEENGKRIIYDGTCVTASQN